MRVALFALIIIATVAFNVDGCIRIPCKISEFFYQTSDLSLLLRFFLRGIGWTGWSQWSNGPNTLCGCTSWDGWCSWCKVGQPYIIARPTCSAYISGQIRKRRRKPSGCHSRRGHTVEMRSKLCTAWPGPPPPTLPPPTNATTSTNTTIATTTTIP